MRTHGLYSTYRSGGCRCGLCRQANTEKAWMDRLRRAERDRDEVPHGAGGYNNWKCRCDVCTDAVRAREQAQRDRTVSAPRSRAAWTPVEVEIATRPDLTALQAARLLGRTYSAIVGQRRKFPGQHRGRGKGRSA